MNNNSTDSKSKMSRRAPIIVFGMHRSGTTMLARQLEALKVFMGQKKDANHESTFFLGINRWLVGQTGGSWDNPQPIHHLLRNHDERLRVAKYVDRYLLRTPRVVSYLGWRKRIRYRSPFDLDIPWGWKCPLNTFTLPIWVDLFPSAKAIHIYRHGVDVANSLRHRGRREAKVILNGLYYKFPIVHAVRPKVGEFCRVRCDSLDGAFSLWEEYFVEAHKHVVTLGERALELKYEDLLYEPTKNLKTIAEFCELPFDNTAIEAVANLVRKERAYAYREKPELSVFAERVAPRLDACGY